MKQLSVSARAFVEGVTSYMEHEEKANLLLPRVTDLFQKVSIQARKKSTAQVVSAIVLTNEEKIQIHDFLEKLLGHSITIEVRVDAAIIAGVRVEVGDWVVDTSFATQLNHIARGLTHL